MTGLERFDPSAYRALRFVDRSLDEAGRVRLRYALDDAIEFEEEFELPMPPGGPRAPAQVIDRLLSLLHWVAGVSYYKIAAPPEVACDTGSPPPATAALLEALYSEGLGEFAVANGLRRLPRPAFPVAPAIDAGSPPGHDRLRRVLVPVGGGKDSAVAIEIVRRSGLELALFSIGNAPPINRTVEVAQLPRLLVTRRLDPGLGALNARGALNGHVPVTAIVSCVALLTAALHGFDAVALANERSASAGSQIWDGVEVNHQFSKSARVETLLAAALAEAAPELQIFSVLRPASELAIARAFARLDQYHPAFTSCNKVFRLDPALRASSWCGDCDKCRFVFLVLAPFLEPSALVRIFGHAMLDDDAQYDGFALLTATGGYKPFECVGEVQESVAAIRLLAEDPRWRDQRVVRRLAIDVLPRFGEEAGDPAGSLALAAEHHVPNELIDDVHALLGA
ncbi:MAG: UDP-N-acetyl-alpha-D-muramoyl-L-alanyl-L-glutamate epimerase [Solirubrobacteraceae bacterium]|nr:UDP-N-acetyl-alpha-D-muramoyl-L-alanyl-L-glutamate epimerase [Solirubrobacteraceae bacterium]